MSEGAESEYKCQRLYGATVARLTPDQKVGSSNLSALISSSVLLDLCDAITSAADFFQLDTVPRNK